MPRLQLAGVQRVFPGPVPSVALRSVNLEIGDGEFISIVGPSGGGKSTLLNVLGLLDRPTDGDYSIAGIDTEALGASDLARLRSTTFAFVFQSFHLLDRRPVVDSVELALMYQAVAPRERRERAWRALQQVGVAHLFWQKANLLSGGERQRVAIARAVATGAPVIVADEPTGNLDSRNSESIVSLFRELNAAGTTVIIVTHSPEVAAAAGRSVSIKDGTLESPAMSGSGAVTAEVDTEPRYAAGVRGDRTPSRLRFIDLVRDAAASVRSRMGRTIGLVAAVGVGVALAVATTGISDTATAQVRDTFDLHANHDVSVAWEAGNETVDASASKLATLSGLPGVQHASVLQFHGPVAIQAAAGREAFDVPAYSGTQEIVPSARMGVHWAKGSDHAIKRGEVLLGGTLADQIALGPLDGSPTVLIGSTEMTVVGLIQKSPRVPEETGGVLVSEHDASMLGKVDRSQALVVTDAGAAQQVAKEAPLVLDPYQPSSLSVTAPTDPSRLRADIESDLRSVLVAFTIVALLASMAGLANAMVLSVLERRQEFGLRRAIGARGVHIAGLVLAESVLIGLAGGVGGLFAGVASVLVVSITKGWVAVFDPTLAPIAVIGGVIVGAVGGAIASIRASLVQPQEALRQ